MKEYKDSSDSGNDSLNEPVAVYDVRETTEFKIPRDENGNPIGTPWEVIRERMYSNLSKHYGVDLAKVSRLIDSGELNEDDLTNELLLGPEFRL
jgi:hypothetical protein